MLKRIFIWLLRCTHCRGFGIQSPSAYQFVRYVINEHYPYYTYDDLRLQLNEMDTVQRLLAKLYFRLANYWQPCMVFNVQPAYAEFISSGCLSSTITDTLPLSLRNHTLLIMPADYATIHATELIQFVTQANANLLLVIEGIHKRKVKPLWKQLLQTDKVSVSFDLFYCGILFFDNRIKQNYKINF